MNSKSDRKYPVLPYSHWRKVKSIRVDLAYDLFPVTVARSGLFGRFKDQFTQHLIPDIIGHLKSIRVDLADSLGAYIMLPHCQCGQGVVYIGNNYNLHITVHIICA